MMRKFLHYFGWWKTSCTFLMMKKFLHLFWWWRKSSYTISDDEKVLTLFWMMKKFLHFFGWWKGSYTILDDEKVLTPFWMTKKFLQYFGWWKSSYTILDDDKLPRVPTHNFQPQDAPPPTVLAFILIYLIIVANSGEAKKETFVYNCLDKYPSGN